MTLRELMEQHPDWADLDIVVYREDGTLHHIDGSGAVYKSLEFPEGTQDVDEAVGEPVLVMAPN